VITASPVVDDVWVLASTQSAPGHGVLPVNAFLLRADPPMLVDTGLPAEREEFMDVLGSLVRPAEIAAVFLSHEDSDHAGNLEAVLDAAPRARLATNYVTLTKLLERTRVPLERVEVVNPEFQVPGQSRRLTVLRPPAYDAPGTVGFHDGATGVVFTADAFGMYLPEGVGDVSDVGHEKALAGLLTFNAVNHPWTVVADPALFGAAIDAIAQRRPAVLLSSHAPPARTGIALLLDGLRRAPGSEAHVPPDQEQFEHRLKPQLHDA
jgi:glyoxylase-like metal-dependent hydrolase (beta-lactamase superfamily II)